ncbi:uncharacterized protein LOC134456481 [Engraulis encrasicolus]|uniref:uncharacterized protein LOC134456481 n=1 Tax=Engraulis encrasicolus TaxID=184585 RepID=UPI002FD600FE
MRAAISLLVLLLSMCGVQTESHGTDASTQDVSTELKELRDMVVELRATLQHTRHDVKVLETVNVAMKERLMASEAENVAIKQSLAVSEGKVEALETENVGVKGRLVASESKVEALERALQDTKAEMKTLVENLMKKSAAQEAELTAVKTRPAATETEVEDLENEIRAAPKVAFSAGLTDSGYIVAGSTDLNLVFSRVITNVGEAYNRKTGFFTAPVRGVYYFRFTVADTLDSRYIVIRMYKNRECLMQLQEHGTDGQLHYLSGGLTLQLEKGDTVNMVLPAGYRLYDNYVYNFCTFSGFLLFPL